jgi:hypothetical protein
MKPTRTPSGIPSRLGAPALASALALAAFTAFAPGCKGGTTVKDSPETLDKLDTCQKSIVEKDKLIKDYEAEAAHQQRNNSVPGEIQIAFENDILTVKPAKPGQTHPIDEKAAAAASKVFFDLVNHSRGAIQKCYEQELKKNSGLQARTVTLMVSASFADSGTFRTAAFNPSFGNTFDACMKTVASKWAMPANTPAMAFKAPVSLTPS